MHYVFKIVDLSNNEIVYIGKCSVNFSYTITTKVKSKQFESINNIGVYCAGYDTREEASAIRSSLLCKYKPRLNTKMDCHYVVDNVDESVFKRYFNSHITPTQIELNNMYYYVLLYNSILNSIKSGEYEIIATSNSEDLSYVFMVDNVLLNNPNPKLDICDFVLNNVSIQDNKVLIDCKDVYKFYSNSYDIYNQLLSIVNIKDNEGYYKYSTDLSLLQCNIDLVKNMVDIFRKIKFDKSFNYECNTLLNISNYLYDYVTNEYNLNNNNPILNIKYNSYSDKTYYYVISENISMSDNYYDEIIEKLENKYNTLVNKMNLLYNAIPSKKVLTAWTNKEEKLLSDCWGIMSREEIYNMFPTRSHNSVNSKIRSMHLTGNSQSIIKKDRAIIDIYYPIEGTKCKQRLSRKYDSKLIKRYFELHNSYSTKSISSQEFNSIDSDDIKIIKEYFPIEGIKCVKRLNRTYNNDTILDYCKLNGIIKIRDKRKITDEEINIINKMIARNHTYREIVDELNKLECNKYLNRSLSNVYQFINNKKNKEDNLIVDIPNEWSKQDDKFLLDNYTIYTAKELAELLPNHTAKDIRRRLKLLGLLRRYAVIDDKDKKIIRMYYPIEGMACRDRLYNEYSEKCIYDFCYRNKIRYYK